MQQRNKNKNKVAKITNSKWFTKNRTNNSNYNNDTLKMEK